MTSLLRHTFELSAHFRPTVGDQKVSYVGVDHMGWLVCDGRAISRTTYALLFNVVGVTFGAGDGSTTFNLPDMRGCVPGMAGKPSFSNGAGDVNPTSNAIGTYLGEQRHKLNIDEMPSHTHGSVNVSGNSNGDGYTTSNGAHDHTITDLGHVHTYRFPTSQGILSAGGPNQVAEDQFASASEVLTSNATTGITINSNVNHQHQIFNTGGSNFHNNMQPTLFTGNMFIYCGRNVDAYFPYTWVGGTPGNVQIY
jgi:microcystin-dependent protein